MSRLNPGRLAAARALLAVERGAHAEDILAQVAPPQGADRGLAWHITLGALRRQGALDQLLNGFLKRPIATLDPQPRVALRIGAFESALSRTAPHAVVDQAVMLTRKLGAGRASGLVNAVLRKAVKAPFPNDPFLDLPPWLARRWADVPDWVGRLRHPPVLSIATVDGAPPVGMDTSPSMAAGRVVPGVFTVGDPSGAVTDWPGFAAGRWWVMDAAAAVVADLCLEGLPLGARVLDACAAPGGKTFRLAARGASVVSVDVDPVRCDRLKQGADRLQFAASVREHDWLSGPMSGDERFDVVLVDAPCTGLGVVRRHPEIRWRRLPTDPAAMGLRQRPILQSAACHVREGGRLVYAVCSPMKEEGEAVVASLSGWSVTRSWRSWPPEDEDAFQAFVLERS
ncbi:MAG: transcription antitermination factor NusB [Myxococcota bacterium]